MWRARWGLQGGGGGGVGGTAVEPIVPWTPRAAARCTRRPAIVRQRGGSRACMRGRRGRRPDLANLGPRAAPGPRGCRRSRPQLPSATKLSPSRQRSAEGRHSSRRRRAPSRLAARLPRGRERAWGPPRGPLEAGEGPAAPGAMSRNDEQQQGRGVTVLQRNCDQTRSGQPDTRMNQAATALQRGCRGEGVRALRVQAARGEAGCRIRDPIVNRPPSQAAGGGRHATGQMGLGWGGQGFQQLRGWEAT